MRPLLVGLVLIAGLSSRASADSAREHYEKGLAAYALGDFKGAATEYEAAFQQKTDPALLYNAAQAHRLAGDKERALFLYENYLRLFPARPNEKEVRRHIAALKAGIESDARVKSSPPTDPLVAPPPSPAPRAEERQAVTVLPVVVAPPQPARSRRWVWGVAGGVVAAVAIGLGVGLGIGLSGSDFPSASKTVTLK